MRNLFEYKNNFDKYHNVKSILLYGDTSQCMNPQITVVMPVFGNPRFFVDAFESVINQETDVVYEVVIVDNTPLDGKKSDILCFLEKSKYPNVFYYRNETNIGMMGNWNRGILLARAELITFCHDDDMLYPFCLSRLLELHAKYPNKFIIPAVRKIDENIHYPLDTPVDSHSFWGHECYAYDKLDIFMGNPTNGVGCLFYKQHMLEIGGYDEEYYPSSDNALHIKYIFQYGAMYYRHTLFCYRISSGNTSHTVYKGFISNGLFYCKCMAHKIHLPKFLISKLTHAFLTKITINCEHTWGNADILSVTPTLSDRLIYKFLSWRNMLKRMGIL